jgi:DNA-binding NarL/FixJ family response regulator
MAPPISVVVSARSQAGNVACLLVLRRDKGIRVVGRGRGALDTIRMVGWLKPRVLLLDLGIASRDGAAVLRLVRRRSPRTRVILLTARISGARALDTLGRGAHGYLEQHALGKFLPEAVRAVVAGEAWVPRKLIGKIVDRLASSIPPRELR